MANFLPLVSETTAGWTKVLSLLLVISFSPVLLFSQEEGDPLSKKERGAFNEMFFEAEKQKNLGNLEKALDLYQALYKMNTTNATVCFELAQIYAAGNKSDDALFYAERAVQLEPKNKWMLMLLASAYRNFDNQQKEIDIFKRLVKLDSLNPDYRFELAISYQQYERYDEAIAALNELEAILGVNEIISNQKKEIYLEQGDLDAAVKEIENLIKTYPKNVDFYGTLAQIYMVNGKEKDALKVYNKMLEIAPEDPRPHLDLAQYYKDQRDFEKSIHHLKKAMLSPSLEIDKKIGVLLSLYDASDNDTVLRKESYDMLATIIEQNPNDPKAYAIYGDFLSRDQKNKEALVMYKKATRLDGGNIYDIWDQILLIEIQTEMWDSLAVDGPTVVDLFPNQPVPYFFSGVALNMTKQLDEAAEYLEAGLPYVIGNPRLKEQFYTQLADIYHQLEEHKKSDNYFDMALALNENNPTALNNYAYYLSVRNQNLDKALKMSEKSNNLSPNNAIFLDTWAWILYQQKNYSKALEVIEKAMLHGGGKSGEVVEHYGDILYKNGMKSKALEQWQKAKALGDASPTIDEKINTQSILE
ncbi:tetratricopeptide repeat protein [Owenweeksia hongkongensis]|uniref:tetratricopeptide repeat protein n=1 Tax=Owenweeksia hongkongensis TaxID=253245 RepID=UPI003A9507AA